MELFERLENNPIITPADVPPSRDGLIVRCVVNPAAFVYRGRVGLLLRVCEQPPQQRGWITTIVRDEQAAGGIRTLRFRKDDPKLHGDDPRLFQYDGQTYLTTLSHLRLARSDDGNRFKVDPTPAVEGIGRYERYGVEDCRVTDLEGRHHLTFTTVSELGVCVGHASTSDFRHFERHGLILPPHNKDCALFPSRVGGRYVAVHRPSGAGIGGHYMWISTSPDLVNWGNPRCLATTRRGMWDCQRVGANGPPIPTDRGWLLLYHGADHNSRYCFGALLLDRDDPSRILARSDQPIMQPTTQYERHGFFGNVVFSNGHVLNGDELMVYYGAADECVGAARGSLSEILKTVG